MTDTERRIRERIDALNRPSTLRPSLIVAEGWDHSPVVEEAYRSWDCIYGECDHDDENECTMRVVACRGCTEHAPIDDESELATIIPWPCLHTTRRGTEQQVIDRLLEAQGSGS